MLIFFLPNEVVQFEDDVVYIIDGNNSSHPYNDISRIMLYGEMEEGKEGDMSDIAVDTTTDTIYAGKRYFQGGREGVFVISDDSIINDNSLGDNDTTNDTKNGIRFIQTYLNSKFFLSNIQIYAIVVFKLSILDLYWSVPNNIVTVKCSSQS